MESKEYLEGREAAQQGEDENQNPYREGTASFNDWVRGYSAAHGNQPVDENHEISMAESVRLREEQAKRDDEKREQERAQTEKRRVVQEDEVDIDPNQPDVIRRRNPFKRG